MEVGAVTIFVHSFEDAEAASAFLRASDDAIAQLLERHLFLVSSHVDAFEGSGGRIDMAHVSRTIEGILDGPAAGRGARVFVDASRTYLGSGREEEWFAFEEQLGRRLRDRVALLCAYTADSVEAPARRERVLRTHLYRFEA